jgi:hypothetical protein
MAAPLLPVWFRSNLVPILLRPISNRYLPLFTVLLGTLAMTTPVVADSTAGTYAKLAEIRSDVLAYCERPGDREGLTGADRRAPGERCDLYSSINANMIAVRRGDRKFIPPAAGPTFQINTLIETGRSPAPQL